MTGRGRNSFTSNPEQHTGLQGTNEMRHELIKLLAYKDNYKDKGACLVCK